MKCNLTQSVKNPDKLKVKCKFTKSDLKRRLKAVVQSADLRY